MNFIKRMFSSRRKKERKKIKSRTADNSTMMIRVPDSWHDVTIRQFTEIMYIVENNNLSEFEKNLQIFSTLTNVSIEDAKKIDIESLNICFERMAFVKEDIEDAEGDFEEVIEINDKLYEASILTSEATTGQYIDLINITNDENQIKYNIHKILACLYVPKGEKYGDNKEKVEEEIYNNINIADAFSTAVFFCNSFKHLTIDIQNYLNSSREQITEETLQKVEKLSKMSRDQMIGSHKDGDGSVQ